jgi:hypothetical protein
MNMPRSRIHYWNNGKFADYIRGSKKPYALEWAEWDQWHVDAAKKHPIRYWIAETGLKKLQDIINYPSDLYYSIKIYVKNRWIDKCHLVNTGLKPGQYYDFDTKILHGLFYELVDYVEIELAHINRWTSKNKNKYKFVNGRSAKAGLDYLKWSASLKYNKDYCYNKDHYLYNKPTTQAIASKKIKELYTWWTVTRPKRKDPQDLSGYSLCEHKAYSNASIKEKNKLKQALIKLDKIEQQYDDEDTEKLIELIKIRHSIWT